MQVVLHIKQVKMYHDIYNLYRDYELSLFDDDLSENYKTIAILAFAVASIIFGIISVILVSSWATNQNKDKDSYLGTPTTLMGYPGSENVFAWHPSMIKLYYILYLFFRFIYHVI